MRRGLPSIVPLFVWMFGLCAASCAKFVLADRKKTPAVAFIPPTQAAPAGPAVPNPPAAPERIIKLTVSQIPPEAEWNSCMFLKVNDGAEVAVGCGMDKAQVGKVVELPAKKDVCNKIKVRMTVTTGCPAPRVCKVETFERDSSKASDTRFFKFMEAAKMLNASGKLIDQAVRPDPTQLAAIADVQKQAIAHTQKAGNTWIRAWFEDQTDAHYDSFVAIPEKHDDYGIDWNDYVIDLKGEDVKFTIDGQAVACGADGTTTAPASTTAPAAGSNGTTPTGATPGSF